MDNDYEKAVEVLTSQGKFYISLGLERISKVLEILGNPQDKLNCIHVAGTNGKGSVCSILASILAEYGLTTGLYTSPHIFEYTERIKINGADISREDFARYVLEICELADKNNIHLTEFEVLTTVMFKYFADKSVEVVVLETGLGGRFDATNVIKKNLCSIITHIDLDHTDRLGTTKEEIAFEKAGIIKSDCPVITSEGYEVIKDKADEGNSLVLLTLPYASEEELSALSLKGSCQRENLALALAAVRLLYKDISEKVILNGLKKVNHPCRFQVFEGKNLVVDGSHNPNGAFALKESLDTYFPTQRRRFIFGCLTTKDYGKMMQILFRPEDEVYFKHFDNPKSATVEELKSALVQNVIPQPHVVKEFSALSNLPEDPDTVTVICGSFYMMKEVFAQQV